MNDAELSMLRAVIAGSPYLRMMGFEVGFEAGELTARLPFADALIGNPLLPALHGGVVAALLHFIASAQLLLERRTGGLPSVFASTNEFLASPGGRTTTASAKVMNHTRRFANLRAVAWQADRAKPVAAATVQFVIG